MMGQLERDQGRFFYDFCLEEHVPKDHLLRRIGRVLDLGDVHEQLRKLEHAPLPLPVVSDSWWKLALA